ncbi:hypothetical protein PCASD_13056 [Puccinia coronata f. sp. avenae]|uniref:Uncharacterized protein n=1 Tax=Puccinia coronata f. sp. avenae TaxID=200324 RepID=A0A2N5U4F1_9BASI|nr:hypothetical protein PCASD_13056 [Puccinia coronata f. sp. avenae]
MPFLYQLLAAKLNQNQKHGVPKTNVEGVEDKAEEDECDNLDNVDFDHGSSPTVEQGAASCQRDHQLQREQRVHVTASTICSMVAFGTNCRDNSLQLENALTFLACGVTEQVSEYLHYIGLCSSRETGHSALQTLGSQASRRIVNQLSIKKCDVIAPIICIDNVDFEERVHSASPEKKTHMFFELVKSVV